MALAASLLALPGLLVQPSLRPSGVVRLQRASAPAMEDEGFKMPDLPDIPNPFGGGGGGGAGGGGAAVNCAERGFFAVRSDCGFRGKREARSQIDAAAKIDGGADAFANRRRGLL